MPRKFYFFCTLAAICFALCANCRAATTEPSVAGEIESYLDRVPDVLQSQSVEDIAPKSPLSGIDTEVTSTKASTTQPTTQPSAQPKQGEFLIVPIPSYKPTFGWGLNMMASYLFPMDKDGDAPPSIAGVMGMYTQNNSWALGLISNLHIDHDEYRVTGGVFTGQMNYDFYGVGTHAGDAGVSVPLHEHLNGAVIEPLFRILPNLYLGPRYQFAQIRTSVDLDGFPQPPAILQAFSQLNTESSAFGIHLQADTRDSEFYPRKGSLFNFSVDMHSTAIGDSFDYQEYKTEYNQYFSLSPRQVIAVRGDFQASAGNVPFYALSQIGRGPDLRGYRPGQFQDKLLLAGQAEYRLELNKYVGVVGFAGVGEVAPYFDQFNFNQLLPSLGGGLRFTISQANHVNLRLDAAWGREGWQGYLTIGEAF
jgi:hypothetical protein